MGTGWPSGQYAPVVVTGSRTKPSIWSGDTPASAMARRRARMLQAPTQVSGLPSQRRAVGEWPTPTAATLPRCSHNPNPSVVRYREAGGCWGVIVRSFLRALCGSGRAEALADDLPLGNFLPVGRGLEDHLDPGSHRDVIDRCARQVGEHLDPRVLVQHNHRDVKGLVLLEESHRTVVHHAVVIDRAPSTHLLPRQMVFGATVLTRRRRGMLQPVAGVTVLDDEPPRVGGVPEGRRQCIGNDTLLGHTAPPCWMVAYGCDVRNTLITPYLCGCCQRMAILGTVGWRVASPSLPAARQAEAAGARGCCGSRRGPPRG